MYAHRGEHRLTTLCNVLNVSPSGFYDWLKSKHVPSRWDERRAVLDTQLKLVCELSNERSGSPRLADDLADAGYNVNKPLPRACGP